MPLQSELTAIAAAVAERADERRLPRGLGKVSMGGAQVAQVSSQNYIFMK